MTVINPGGHPRSNSSLVCRNGSLFNRTKAIDELEIRYRQAKDPIERSHYQIIWLLATGRPTEEVADVTGYSRNWIYELVWGYNRLSSRFALETPGIRIKGVSHC